MQKKKKNDFDYMAQAWQIRCQLHLLQPFLSPPGSICCDTLPPFIILIKTQVWAQGKKEKS